MRARTYRRTIAGLAGLLAALLGWVPAASGEPKQQWQRVLSEADAKEVARLEKQWEDAFEAERWDDAIRAAEAIRDLRKAKQGADHWEVADAEWVVKNARWTKGATAEQRRERREALGKNWEAITASGQGKYAGAKRLLGEVVALFKAALPPGHPDIATSLGNLAATLRELGRDAEAEPLYREALALRWAALPPGHLDIAFGLNDLAVNLRDLGRSGEAEALQREALSLARSGLPPGHSDAARFLNSLAVTLHGLGRDAEAEPLHREALALRRAALPPGHPHIATSLGNLAATLCALGRDAEAEPLLREALGLLRAALPPDHPEIARSLTNLAAALVGLNRLDEAEPLYREALALYRAVHPPGHPDIAASLSNLATVLFRLGRAGEAEPLHREALALLKATLPTGHPGIAASLGNLAATLIKLGRDAEAEPLHREALTLQRAALPPGHPHIAHSLSSLAVALMYLGRVAEAEPLLAEALAASELARLSAGPSGASRSDFAAASASPALGLAVLRTTLGKPLTAWEAAEAQFARGLLDDLARGDLTPAERDESARLSTRLAALEKPLLTLVTSRTQDDATKSRVEAIRAESRDLSAKLGAIAARQSTRLVAPFERVQRTLRPDEALTFWVDAEFHYGCVVRHTGEPVWVFLPGKGKDGRCTPADHELTHRARAALASPTPDAAALLAKLRAQRVEPLLPHLKGVTHLFAIPAGDLAGIPLEALDLPFRVSYTPSASVLAFTRERHRQLGRSLLAVGAPEYLAADKPAPEPPTSGLYLAFVLPGQNAARAGLRAGDVLLEYDGAKLSSLESFQKRDAGQRVKVRYWRDGTAAEAALEPGPLGVQMDKRSAAEAVASARRLDDALARRGDTFEPLHGARAEIDALCGLAPEARKLVGADASVRAIRKLAQSGDLAKYRLLHFATHGTTDAQRASNCALVLSQIAGTPDADGRLTAGEIDTWKLDADLAVLSACQTGLGRDAKGEGLLGFTQVLMRRGVRSVVVSLWKVDDAATALLMRRFYANLLERKMGRASALAEAKAWLRGLTRDEALAAAGELGDGVVRGSVERLKPAAGDVPAVKGGERVFAHPFYWSAFVLLGDPD